MTAQNLIEGAYRLIGRRNLEYKELEEGLLSLNDLITSWRLEKLIPFNSSFSTLSSTITHREYARVIKYNLAIELGQEGNEKISGRIQSIAKKTKDAMKDAAAVRAFNEEASFDSYLTHTLRR
jgi:hypothetical protein